MTDMKNMGRLAFRVEGSWWRCYWAMPDTMDGAIELGSIRMAAVEGKTMKEAFMKIMRDAASIVIEDIGLGKADWPDAPVPAPEHERGGNA